MGPTSNTLPPWKQQAFDLQESFHKTLSDRKYDHFTALDPVTLKKELGYAMFGAPPTVATPQTCGYGTVETSLIDEVFQFIRYVNKGAENYYISFVFVVCCLTGEGQHLRPVFRVNCCGNVMCDKIHGLVDDTPRFYKSWGHYLETNLLPRCVMGYPSGGSYWRPPNDSAGFQLSYRLSPDHNIGNQIRSCLDFTASRIGGAASIICIASKYAVFASAPKLAFAEIASVLSCNVVNTYLGVNKLMDRFQHGQSISVANPEVRTCYINILAGVSWAVSSLGLVLLNDMAMTKQILTLEMRRDVARVTIVALVVSGGRVVNYFFNIRRKRRNGEAVTSEVGNFIAACYSHYGTGLTAQRARTLVDNWPTPRTWTQKVFTLFSNYW